MSSRLSPESNDGVDHTFVLRDKQQAHAPPSSHPGVPPPTTVPQYLETSQRFLPRPSDTHIAYSEGLQNIPIVPVRQASQTTPEIGRESQSTYHISDDIQSRGLDPKSTYGSHPPLEVSSSPEVILNTFQSPERLPRSHQPPASYNVGQQDYYQSNSLPFPQVAYPPFIPRPAASQTAPRRYHPFGTLSSQAPYPAYVSEMQSVPVIPDSHRVVYPEDTPSNPAFSERHAGGRRVDTFVIGCPFVAHTHPNSESGISYPLPDTITTTVPPSCWGQDLHYASPTSATYPDNTDTYNRPPPTEPYLGEHYSPSAPYPTHIPQTPPPEPIPFVISANEARSQKSFARVAVKFMTRTLPRQVYLHFLLRLPLVYFSRVARIFEATNFTLPEIKKMALETASKDRDPNGVYIFDSTNLSSRRYARLKSAWEAFINSLIREWEMFNLISVLLLSAILAILQIESAAQDPITRYTALSSSICALISILFGCMYIVRFGSMRHMSRATEWASEARKTRTTIWWDVWVMLAMPAIWFTWSISLYIACIMTFIWRTSAQDDTPPIVMSKTALLVVRVVISAVLGLGVIYGGMSIMTFRQYGYTYIIDEAWDTRIDEWLGEKNGYHSPGSPSQGQNPHHYMPHSLQPYPLDLAPPVFLPPPPSPTSIYIYNMPDDSYGYPPVRNARLPNVEPLTTSTTSVHVPSLDPQNIRNPWRKNSANTTTSASVYGTNIPHSDVLNPRNSLSGTQRKNYTDRNSTHEGPSHTLPDLPLPQVPPKIYVPPPSHLRGALKKRRLSIPPPSLPTVPGSPGSGSLSYLTSTAHSSLHTSMFNPASFGLSIQFGEILDEELGPQPDLRVRFRSPLVSAQESLDRGNEMEVVKSVKSNISEPTGLSTSVPRTPLSSPIPPDY